MAVQAQAQSTSPRDANAVCAPCHQSIYERYRATPMARASGDAVDGFIPADFRHSASKIHYTVTREENRVWLTYDRDDPARPLHGRQELRYFLGSGHRGRTFLFEQAGFWFELPINWYAKKQIWDMTPNHLQDREMPLTLPVDSGCLRCHASQVASSLPDAQNHFAAAPFAQGGITCIACHGNAGAHLASHGKIPMLNLKTLPPERRDSICLSCHLEGDTTVFREGHRIEDFVPGEKLADFEQVFVYRNESGSDRRATSQWEALLQSACWKASKGMMTCTTCHDPHGSPAQGERVAFYRQKCLQCHNQAQFATTHHSDQPDCTSCHMLRSATSDIAHEQVTDHWIRKRIPAEPPAKPTTGELEAVGGLPSTDRDLGLAYAQMAERGDQAAALRAMELLQKAEKHDADADHDDQLHMHLGFLDQVSGNLKSAAAEYRDALAANPYDPLALGNLALLEVGQHREREAEDLLRTVVEHDPGETKAGLNLAIVSCRLHDPVIALDALERVLKFSPDNEKAHQLAAAIRSGSLACGKQEIHR